MKICKKCGKKLNGKYDCGESYYYSFCDKCWENSEIYKLHKKWEKIQCTLGFHFWRGGFLSEPTICRVCGKIQEE